MAVFGRTSKRNLTTVEPALAHVLERVIPWLDFSVTEGHRGEADQNEAFDKGFSKLRYPDSLHNVLPSKAVHAAPFPVSYSPSPKNLARFYFLAGAVFQAAHELGVDLRWGGDWDSDRDFSDQTFDDLAHFELRE